MIETRPAIRQFEGLVNFRDLGGLTTIDGRQVRTGMCFRSEDLSRLTDGDRTKLRELGLRSVCDLRSPEEARARRARLLEGEPIRMLHVPLHDRTIYDVGRAQLIGFLFGADGGDRFRDFRRRYYRHIVFEQARCVGEVVGLMAQPENLPMLVHCTAGKDRTGIVAATVLLALGVPYDRVVEDYLLSNEAWASRLHKVIRIARVATLFRVSTERMKLVLMARRAALDEVHREMLDKHGSVERYLVDACGVDADALAQLKSQLIV